MVSCGSHVVWPRGRGGLKKRGRYRCEVECKGASPVVWIKFLLLVLLFVCLGEGSCSAFASRGKKITGV